MKNSSYLAEVQKLENSRRAVLADVAKVRKDALGAANALRDSEQFAADKAFHAAHAAAENKRLAATTVTESAYTAVTGEVNRSTDAAVEKLAAEFAKNPEYDQ
jgi:hypothetical protein